jgi:hypothetical protein
MSDRTTESGIVLPDVEERGVPVIHMAFDVPGLSLSVVGPDDDDLVEMAERIATAQRGIAHGEHATLITARDPIYGERLFVMPAAVNRIMYVDRGYARKVDVSAMPGMGRVLPARPDQIPPSARRLN